PSTTSLDFPGGEVDLRWSVSGSQTAGYITVETTIGTVTGYDEDGGGDVYVLVSPNTKSTSQTGTVTVYYVENDETVATATATITLAAAPYDNYSPALTSPMTSSVYLGSSLSSREEVAVTFRFTTDGYTDSVRVASSDWYGAHTAQGNAYGINSLTLNGTELTKNGTVTLSPGTTYEMTAVITPAAITSLNYGCEFSLTLTPCVGDWAGSPVEFQVYTGNAGEITSD
ncbi:MAG: hypothetical protein LUE27_08110, partial [Clostridia bacterium]|nr:hypothetical protein [Clostridia bacterium]